jgi:hypothetical protein
MMEEGIALNIKTFSVLLQIQNFMWLQVVEGWAAMLLGLTAGEGVAPDIKTLSILLQIQPFMEAAGGGGPGCHATGFHCRRGSGYCKTLSILLQIQNFM